MVYQIPRLFPTPTHENLLICVSAFKAGHPLLSNCVTDLHFNGDTQCFPRYYYEAVDVKQRTMFTQTIDGYTRHDAITDYIHNKCRSKYGQKVTKDQIFYYVYGLLHSKDYRETFSADLKKLLPRIPLVESADDFEAFYKAGKDLAKLHLNYETVAPYSKAKVTGLEKGNFLVDKIRYVAKEDKSTIQFNSFIRISNIPLTAFDYVINGRSPIDWIIERYQVSVDKDSGLKNDPNDWAKEQKEPRYILDLLLRVITVSLETMKIVNGLPKLDF
jgi:predicted helicase